MVSRNFIIAGFTNLLLLIFFYPSLVRGERIDSCQTLIYHSPLERKGFEALCSGARPDYLTMAVAVDPKSGDEQLLSIKNAIFNEVTFLKASLLKIKKGDKKLKFIFDDVQSKFLKKYDLDAGFSGMFENGNYNCLTACILYANLLDQLSIRHNIKFMPSHVYIVAYDNETPFMFETTDPVSGFYEIGKSLQSETIQGLRLIQIISSDSKTQQSDNKIFEQYFTKLNNTDLTGLVGFQYMNLVSQNLIKNDPLTAYELLKRVALLTPMDELGILEVEILKGIIYLTGKTVVARAGFLAEYLDISKDPDKKNKVADEFKTMMYYCLFSSFPAPDSARPIYNALITKISDKEVKSVITDIFITNLAKYKMENQNFDEFFEFLYSSYSEGLRNNFIDGSLRQAAYKISSDLPDGFAGVKEYDSIAKKYPLLLDFKEYSSNLCYILTVGASNAYRIGNSKAGEKLLERLETEKPDSMGGKYCDPCQSYCEAGSYYLRKGNTAKAKAMLRKGLTFDPSNWELNRKLKEVR